MADDFRLDGRGDGISARETMVEVGLGWIHSCRNSLGAVAWRYSAAWILHYVRRYTLCVAQGVLRISTLARLAHCQVLSDFV